MEKDTTISLAVNPNLLAEAQGENMDLAELFERALLRELSTPTAKHLKNKRGEAWQNENAEAIRAWNEEARRNGLWSDGLRQF